MRGQFAALFVVAVAGCGRLGFDSDGLTGDAGGSAGLRDAPVSDGGSPADAVVIPPGSVAVTTSTIGVLGPQGGVVVWSATAAGALDDVETTDASGLAPAESRIEVLVAGVAQDGNNVAWTVWAPPGTTSAVLPAVPAGVSDVMTAGGRPAVYAVEYPDFAEWDTARVAPGWDSAVGGSIRAHVATVASNGAVM